MLINEYTWSKSDKLLTFYIFFKKKHCQYWKNKLLCVLIENVVERDIANKLYVLKKSEQVGTALLYNRYRMDYCYGCVKFELDDIL